MLNHSGSATKLHQQRLITALAHFASRQEEESMNIPDSLKEHAAYHANVMLVCVSDMRLCVCYIF